MTGWKEQADLVTGTDTDLADFILNGPDTGAAGELKQQYRDTCDRFSNAPDWASSLSAGSYNSLAEACEPYLEDAGYDIPTVEPPPFTGGQCEGQDYFIFFDTRTRSSSISICDPFSDWAEGGGTTVIGPVTSFRSEVVATGGFFQDLRTSWYYTAAGVEQLLTTSFWHSSCGPSREIRNFRPVPVSGTDDCGDLPTEITPVDPAPDPGPSPSGNPSDNPDNPNDPIVPVPIICGEGGTTCVTVEYTGQEPSTYCGPGCLYWDCTAVDPEDPSTYTFQLFDGNGDLLYENVAESCPNVELTQNIPEVGFVCTCPDWGKATSYNQTLFSSSVRLREWVVSNAGSRADCKHIMAAKRIMGIDQPIYTDPPYSAPPGPSTPG